MRCLTLACVLFLAAIVACGDNTEPSDPLDAAVVDTDAAPDAGVDAPTDAEVDAELATHPPFPMPSPCDTCVGFGCDQVCADAGVDAP